MSFKGIHILGILVLLLLLVSLNPILSLANDNSGINPSGERNLPNTLTSHSDEGCLVPCDQLIPGQVKDGIPSIDNPSFVDANHDQAPRSDSDVIIGVVLDGTARAYPYNILDWHEIVNDNIDGKHFSVTYCPLTGTGILYHTEVLSNSELGVSGKLFENNLVFYDRNTDSYWSQMMGFSVKGEQMGEKLNYSTAVETTWGAWKKLHPETEVLSRDTGFSRDYDFYPYGDYRNDASILFLSTYNPNISPYNLYHPKALTVVLQSNGLTKLLPSEELQNVPVLNHEFDGQSLVTIFDDTNRLSITFSSVLADGTRLFFASSDLIGTTNSLGLPVFQDTSGSIWNFNGEAIAGSHRGEVLIQQATYNAYWFAASTFFHDATIFQGAESTSIDQINVYTEQEQISFSVDPEVQETSFLDLPFSLYAAFALLVITITRIRKKARKI
ncbi:MAG: DUF3179 domain-containing protein [Candidatus Kariarchaeaceae archaeon]|jgi:hypothetical protein